MSKSNITENNGFENIDIEYILKRILDDLEIVKNVKRPLIFETGGFVAVNHFFINQIITEIAEKRNNKDDFKERTFSKTNFYKTLGIENAPMYRTFGASFNMETDYLKSTRKLSEKIITLLQEDLQQTYNTPSHSIEAYSLSNLCIPEEKDASLMKYAFDRDIKVTKQHTLLNSKTIDQNIAKGYTSIVEIEYKSADILYTLHNKASNFIADLKEESDESYQKQCDYLTQQINDIKSDKYKEIKNIAQKIDNQFIAQLKKTGVFLCANILFNYFENKNSLLSNYWKRISDINDFLESNSIYSYDICLYKGFNCSISELFYNAELPSALPIILEYDNIIGEICDDKDAKRTISYVYKFKMNGSVEKEKINSSLEYQYGKVIFQDTFKIENRNDKYVNKNTFKKAFCNLVLIYSVLNEIENENITFDDNFRTLLSEIEKYNNFEEFLKSNKDRYLSMQKNYLSVLKDLRKDMYATLEEKNGYLNNAPGYKYYAKIGTMILNSNVLEDNVLFKKDLTNKDYISFSKSSGDFEINYKFKKLILHTTHNDTGDIFSCRRNIYEQYIYPVILSNKEFSNKEFFSVFSRNENISEDTKKIINDFEPIFYNNFTRGLLLNYYNTFEENTFNSILYDYIWTIIAYFILRALSNVLNNGHDIYMPLLHLTYNERNFQENLRNNTKLLEHALNKVNNLTVCSQGFAIQKLIKKNSSKYLYNNINSSLYCKLPLSERNIKFKHNTAIILITAKKCEKISSYTPDEKYRQIIFGEVYTQTNGEIKYYSSYDFIITEKEDFKTMHQLNEIVKKLMYLEIYDIIYISKAPFEQVTNVINENEDLFYMNANIIEGMYSNDQYGKLHIIPLYYCSYSTWIYKEYRLSNKENSCKKLILSVDDYTNLIDNIDIKGNLPIVNFTSNGMVLHKQNGREIEEETPFLYQESMVYLSPEFNYSNEKLKAFIKNVIVGNDQVLKDDIINTLMLYHIFTFEKHENTYSSFKLNAQKRLTEDIGNAMTRNALTKDKGKYSLNLYGALSYISNTMINENLKGDNNE